MYSAHRPEPLLACSCMRFTCNVGMCKKPSGLVRGEHKGDPSYGLTGKSVLPSPGLFFLVQVIAEIVFMVVMSKSFT